MLQKLQIFLGPIFIFAAIISDNTLPENPLPTSLLKSASKSFAFVNSIVDGGKCNTFGYDKYVQNSDAGAGYNVTVKVEEYKAGSGSKEFQKVVSVPAGDKTYVGCSVSPATDGPSYTYSVVGESKQ